MSEISLFLARSARRYMDGVRLCANPAVKPARGA